MCNGWLPGGVGQKTASLRLYFSALSENDHGSMNLASGLQIRSARNALRWITENWGKWQL